MIVVRPSGGSWLRRIDQLGSSEVATLFEKAFSLCM